MIRYSIFVLLLVVLLSGIFLYTSYKELGSVGFPLDDSWIHLTFSRNIANGYGFSYNPGIPVNGSTAPLWTFFLTPIFLITDNFFPPVIALGIILTILVVIFVLLLAKTFPQEPGFLWFIALATIITPPLIWSSLSGMEPPLYSLLVIAGIYFHLRFGNSKSILQYLSTLFFGLVIWVRPECMVIFPLAMVDKIWFQSRKIAGISLPRERWISMIPHLVIFLLILFGWMVFNYSLGGSFFPTAFYAKQYLTENSGLLSAIRRLDIHRLGELFLINSWKWNWDLFVQCSFNNLFLIFFFIPGILEYIAYAKSENSNHPSLLILFILIFQPMAMGFISPQGEIEAQHQRYTTHFFPLYVLLSSFGLFRILKYLSFYIQKKGEMDKKNTIHEWILYLRSKALQENNIPKILYSRWITISFLILILWSVFILKEENRLYRLNVKNIQELQVQMGKWLHDNTQSTESIATNDVGAIGFFAERKIVDIVGLITPEILPYFEQKGTRSDIVMKYLSEHPVDYLVIYPDWYPDLVSQQNIYQEIHRIQIRQNITSGSDTMVVYKMLPKEQGHSE